MKKIYILLLTVFMVLSAACSEEKVPDTTVSPAAEDMTLPQSNAEHSDYVYTAPDERYRTHVTRTMMTLGLNNLERSWNNCVIQPDGALWNWSGDVTQKIMDDVVDFSSNDYNVLVVKNDGSLWSFKRKDYFSAPLSGGFVEDPVYIMDNVTSVLAKPYYSMAIRSDGSLWAWGRNNFGQLGDGTTESRQQPVKIMENVASVSATDSHAMVIQRDGSLWTWGTNGHGSVGDGTAGARLRPVKIMENVASAYSLGSHAVAIQFDGSLWAWGANDRGQVGDGTGKDRYKPVKIMEDVVEFSAPDSLFGFTYLMALRSDGSLWTWGYNTNIIFDAQTMQWGEEFLKPVKIMDNVISFSTASDNYNVSFAMAIQSDGSLWTWGRNIYGQLGTGGEQDSSEPVKIMDNIAYASALSDQFAIAVGTDDSIWVWGKGTADLIPDTNENTTSDINTPYRVDLGNLPHNDGEADWLMIGKDQGWGIAGYPPAWSVHIPTAIQLVSGTRVPTAYYVNDENGRMVVEIGLLYESRGIEALSDLIDWYNSSSLSYESFDFNDGNTGLMIWDDDIKIWVNGSAVMAYHPLNFTCDEDILLDMARTLCDRRRDNRVFLESINKKLDELGAVSPNDDKVSEENGSSTANSDSNVISYKGISISQFLGSADDVIGLLGDSPFNDEFKLRYDDMEFYHDNGNIISLYSFSPSLFEADGIPLNKNREELIKIFGQPIEEGNGGSGYFMRYNLSDCSINFELGEPDTEAWRISISPGKTTDSVSSEILSDGESISADELIGNFSYDASFTDPTGMWNNFYYLLEIEWDNSDLMVTKSWRGMYIFDHVRVSSDSLTGNTLVFTSTPEPSLAAEPHSLTYIPAKDSPLGKDTIYIDNDKTMPYVRE